MLMGTADALVHNSMPLKSRHYVSSSSSSLSVTMSAIEDTKKSKFRPNPVVVSAEAEALSHSDTTMKLVPSYDLFRMLTEEEGGDEPELTYGNAMRDGKVLKEAVGEEDPLEGVQLSMFKGCGESVKSKHYPTHSKWSKRNCSPFLIRSKSSFRRISQSFPWQPSISLKSDTERDFDQRLFN